MSQSVTPYDARFYAGLAERVSGSARVGAPLIMDLLAPRSAIDIGCGHGDWLHALQLCGVEEILGVDGVHVNPKDLNIPEAAFLAWDLTQPLRVERRFDVALSLEVAEHLPSHCAELFVRSLTALAPAVVFSAAVPGQGGVQHVNEQWPWYWQERFAAAGYRCLDILRKSLWGCPDVAAYYQQNLYLFVDPAVHAPLLEKHSRDEDTTLTLVQTYILKQMTAPTESRWRRLLRRLSLVNP
jgi:hypothetical protein